MNKTRKDKKEKLELLTIQWEYPLVGYSDTVTARQYAYFLTDKGEIIKKEVKLK